MVLDQMCPSGRGWWATANPDFLAGRDKRLCRIRLRLASLPDEWALADRQAYSVEKLQNMLLDFTQGGD